MVDGYVAAWVMPIGMKDSHSEEENEKFGEITFSTNQTSFTGNVVKLQWLECVFLLQWRLSIA